MHVSLMLPIGQIFTGRPLFTGQTDSDMTKAVLALTGAPPPALLARSIRPLSVGVLHIHILDPTNIFFIDASGRDESSVEYEQASKNVRQSACCGLQPVIAV